MDECEMVASKPMMKDYDGPCRETAKTLLERIIMAKRREVAGLEALLKIADHLENGSAAEEMLWELAGRYSRGPL